MLLKTNTLSFQFQKVNKLTPSIYLSYKTIDETIKNFRSKRSRSWYID